MVIQPKQRGKAANNMHEVGRTTAVHEDQNQKQLSKHH